MPMNGHQIKNIFSNANAQRYYFVKFFVSKKREDGNEIKNDIDFSDYLLDEGVAVVPGEAFGCSNFFRISFALSNEDILKGCKKIISACSKLK